MTNLIIVICLSVAFFESCAAKEPFKLEEFIKGDFVNKGWNGKWISDNSFIYKEDGEFYNYNAENKENTTILSKDILDNYNGATIELHPVNENLILIKHDVESVFRHSIIAKYTIFDTNTKQARPIYNGEHLQYCRWGHPKDTVIYVFENNIYFEDYNNENLSGAITLDGIEGEIYNGIPDWVYEEEVLSSGEAMWLSPDGQYLAFAQFNDTDVPFFPYFMYGNSGDSNKYPTVINLKYPKVGEINPNFKIIVAHLETKTLRDLPLDTTNYDILFGATWSTTTKIMVLTMNRVQNESVLSECPINSPTNKLDDCIAKKTLLSEKGWLYSGIPIYSDDGDKMIQVESRGGYAHLILTTDLDKMENSELLTTGEIVVTKIHGFDNENNIVFYEAAFASSHSQQQVFSYDINKKTEICLTCELSTPDGKCQYATADFSKNMNFVALICQGPGPTIVTIKKLQPAEDTLEWENNQVLRDMIKNKYIPTIKDFEIPGDNYTIKARLLLPPDFSDSNKYPMLINVYGGPQSNQIKDTFSLGFEKYLVTNSKYIYAFIDGRGSGRRGDDLMYQIYHKLGTFEIEDQILAAKELSKKSFIDSDRIGIWGWSYGGFATAWAMVKDTENVFKCGLSVAPVTNFVYYDSIYTERYMGLLEDNEEGYNNTDVTRHVELLRDKQYFLIHGNADDNVHYQQSMLFARALELADVPFKQMSYPDENHGLRGVYPHLYHSMDSYWKDCFYVENRMNSNIPSIALIAIFTIITKLF